MVCKVDFQNSEGLPLHELHFLIKENGVQLKVPALNNRWVKPRCYTKFHGIPLENGKLSNQVLIDEWLHEAEWFCKDLEQLLGLEHFRFWSTLVYDPKSVELIISFLQEAIPHYIPVNSISCDDNVVSLYTKILDKVLKILCRMITNKESETEWIRKQDLGKMLYSKFIISVPMMFDIIVAYGRSNINVLTKIIQTIFKIEPKYNEDLKLGLKFLKNAFKTIQGKIENEGREEGIDLPTLFDDLALYSLDCAITLCLLLETYPEARRFCSDLNMDLCIAHFYDTGIPLLYKNISLIDNTSKSIGILNSTRMELLKAFRHIVYMDIDNIIMKPSESLIPAEHFIAILTECLSERTFVVDYQKYFPIGSDIEILQQACKELDLFKVDFVLRAYTSESQSYFVESPEKYSLVDESIEDYSGEPSEIIQVVNNEDFPRKRNITEEVNQVLDLLPHLGDGFIHRVLERYNSPESAVTAILEGNLPPDLADADQTEVYIPPDLRDQIYLETGNQRLNIYDGDKYDIMTQDNPECIIKTGKGFPGQPKTAKQLLDDKSYVREMKSRYQEYSLVEEDKEYEDEYDDSYEALADSETKSKKMASANNVIADEVDDDESEEELVESKTETDKQTQRDKSRDFCENPADIRARYEARRNMFLQKRPAASETKNVAGSTKGQGQDKSVLANRRKKEANKSSRANHNRKSGASWKRSRGMIPS